jgi:Flp pilus assembly protein TadD
MHEHDWAGAERQYRQALALAPNDNYYRWGWAMFEMDAARYEEAVADFRWALEQAPLSPELHRQLPMSLACAGRFREAETYVRESLVEWYGDDDPGVLNFLGRMSLREGAEGRAVAQLERAVENSDGRPGMLRSLAYAYASVGREDDARALIPSLEAEDAWMPEVYAALGEPDRALDQLEQGYEQGSPALLAMRCFPPAAFADLTELDGLAGHPRMEGLLRRIDFPG